MGSHRPIAHTVTQRRLNIVPAPADSHLNGATLRL